MTTSDDSQPPPFRHYLKEWRLKRGLTQQQLAQRLNTTKGHISRYERGHRAMTSHVQFRLMRALGITPVQFFMHPDLPSADALLERLAPADRQRYIKALRVLIDENNSEGK